jgi:hypothetical protein
MSSWPAWFRLAVTCGSNVVLCKYVSGGPDKTVGDLLVKHLPETEQMKSVRQILTSKVADADQAAVEVDTPLGATRVLTNFEKLNNGLCKYMLGVHKKSSNLAVKGELGRFPLLINILDKFFT